MKWTHQLEGNIKCLGPSEREFPKSQRNFKESRRPVIELIRVCRERAIGLAYGPNLMLGAPHGEEYQKPEEDSRPGQIEKDFPLRYVTVGCLEVVPCLVACLGQRRPPGSACSFCVGDEKGRGTLFCGSRGLYAGAGHVDDSMYVVPGCNN